MILVRLKFRKVVMAMEATATAMATKEKKKNIMYWINTAIVLFCYFGFWIIPFFCRFELCRDACSRYISRFIIRLDYG